MSIHPQRMMELFVKLLEKEELKSNKNWNSQIYRYFSTNLIKKLLNRQFCRLLSL